ncbi:MAG: hypothetical protein ACLUHB_12745 [Odoribacter splanchnicus]
MLCSGDDYAQSMGVYPQHTRMTGMVVTSLITAVAVSFFRSDRLCRTRRSPHRQEMHRR